MTLSSEIQFGRGGQPGKFFADAFVQGDVVLGTVIGDTHHGHALTLGQAIQLRDFLNRHIDELALKQTGSLAERAQDGSGQLSAVEELPNGLLNPPPLSAEAYRQIAEWHLTGDVGVSSQTIVRVALGLIPVTEEELGDWHVDRPHDVGDLRRCIELIRAVPELEAYLPVVASLLPEWEHLVANWPQLVDLNDAQHDATAEETLRKFFRNYRR